LLLCLGLSFWRTADSYQIIALAISPMIIRWQAHRYLLGQSMSFLSGDFAGRNRDKVMQNPRRSRSCD